MFPVNDLTVLIVTFKTNHKILDDCIKSIAGKSKIIIVENSKDEQFKKAVNFEKNRQLTMYSTLHYKRIYNSADINEK